MITEVNVKMDTTNHLNNFELSIIMGTRRSGANVPKTTTISGFSFPTVSRAFREWQLRKFLSDKGFCGRKRLMNENEKQVAYTS